MAYLRTHGTAILNGTLKSGLEQKSAAVGLGTGNKNLSFNKEGNVLTGQATVNCQKGFCSWM